MVAIAGRDRYQLTLHAENLPNQGGRCFSIGKSSPYAIIKVTSGSNKGLTLGETEPILHELSPEWTKTFFLEFSSSEVTNLEVTVMDYCNGDEPKWIGEANFEATSVFQSPGRTSSDQIGRSDNSK